MRSWLKHPNFTEGEVLRTLLLGLLLSLVIVPFSFGQSALVSTDDVLKGNLAEAVGKPVLVNVYCDDPNDATFLADLALNGHSFAMKQFTKFGSSSCHSRYAEKKPPLAGRIARVGYPFEDWRGKVVYVVEIALDQPYAGRVIYSYVLRKEGAPV